MKHIYVDMVGDLFHCGHVQFLKTIKQLSPDSILIVGVHSDEECTRYKRTPIMNIHERVQVIESCRYVDKVIPNAPLRITKEYIETHHIQEVYHAHSEQEHHKYEYMYKVPIEMGIFKRINYTNGISTTNIIQRIKKK